MGIAPICNYKDVQSIRVNWPYALHKKRSADAEVTADTSLVVPPIRKQVAYSKENSKKLHWTLDRSCNRANTHAFNKVSRSFDRGTGNDRECPPPLGIEYVLHRKYSRGND